MFDLEKAKKESGLSTNELNQLEEQVKAEFEGDEMMFELHLLRILQALRKGWITLKEAITKEVQV